MMIEDKRGIEGTLLTWILATLIVFFIMLFFVMVVGILAAEQKITVSGIDIEKYGGVDYDRVSTMDLISFLETEVFGMKMRDIILQSLDAYIENNEDLETLDRRRPLFGEFLLVTKEKDNLLFVNSQEILDDVCEDYMLKLPQGIIKKGEEDFVPEEDFETSAWKETFLTDWGLWSDEIIIPYKNNIVKIKYRQLKKC